MQKKHLLTTAICSVLVLAGVLATGCDGCDNPFDSYQKSAKAAEAEGTFMVILDGAQDYYKDDQYWSEPGDSEPWHLVSEDDSSVQPGLIVDPDQKTFPGGPDITLRSSPQIPEQGQTVAPDPYIEEDVDFDAQDVLSHLRVNFDMASYFRYTYETGPDTGEDATVTITAEANFDPDTPEHHTAIRKMKVNPDGTVDVVEEETQHEFQ